MQAPILKLSKTLECLKKEMKSLQETEFCAKAEVKQIMEWINKLKAEAEGALSNK